MRKLKQISITQLTNNYYEKTNANGGSCHCDDGYSMYVRV